MALSVTRVVNDIMLAYDHNRNGQIDLQRPTAEGGLLSRAANRLRNPDERVRSNTNTVITEDEIQISTTVRTRFPLFAAADANHDKAVTAEELTAVVSRYDRNGNGQLEGSGIRFWRNSEKREFKRDFGERTEAYSNIRF